MTLKSKPSSKRFGYREELHSWVQSLGKWGEASIKEPVLETQRLCWEANLMPAKGKCQRELSGFALIRLHSRSRTHSMSATYVPSWAFRSDKGGIPLFEKKTKGHS